MNQAPEYLDERALAGRLGLACVTLQVWRSKGKGPPFLKLGRVVRYSWTDVSIWLDAQRVG